ncbi:ArgE/DapE family deacylase [Conexibacter woesei]|uniref:Acetylornithine deacetylase or succinyl-diaminopimelate desuccinylase n=1 Tax=Conexibacter woesei (strain DSM 14684 / CCUG 47730 / CIP 108061 / JCM 11494 / NBRC 100937 / ID131577) TaxID=469383 RepID=D3FAH4_CONWI|nr:ArgE/DapE family deacylase [Conexibacter woesei]ADB49243.1 acetylornithine deacetylase or succinyl- diaminopimelate desuccinylase [Conexibacter woesei DSM 14684]
MNDLHAEPDAVRVLAALEATPDRVVEITSELVRRDTAYARDTPYAGPAAPHGQEADAQAWIGAFLERLGFDVQIWEPDPAEVAGHPMYPDGLTWEGRPVLAAVKRGSGGGRSLILNGHLDTVRCEPLERWTRDPWTPTVEGDRLYGRGSCDMKGGIAAALAAAEAIVQSGAELAGDLHVQIAPDEETTGMGVVALLRRGERADACLVPEPSSFQVYAAYRGILYGNVTVAGLPGHAEIPQAHHSLGGGVNAIDQMRKVMDAFDALSEEWQGRPDKQHPLLSTPRIFPTRIAGGEFIASLPGACTMDFDLTYLPGEAEEGGWGGNVRREVEEHLARAAAADPWLREHPPVVTWTQDYPAAETPLDTAFGGVLCDASAAQGVESAIDGFDTWADAGTYLLDGIPAYCYGPGAIERAHMIDEWVSVDELRTCAAVIARVVTDWCGAPAAD